MIYPTYDYTEDCPPVRPKTLYFFIEGVKATDEEAAIYQEITKMLPPYTCVVEKPIYIYQPNAVYSGPTVGMMITMDGFLTTTLFTVPYEEFDITLVPWDNVL